MRLKKSTLSLENLFEESLSPPTFACRLPLRPKTNKQTNKKKQFKWNKEKLNPKRDASPFKIMNTLVKSHAIA